MPTFLELLAPSTLHQPAITLQLARPRDLKRAFFAIGVAVSVDASLAPGGLVLPIEELITGPRGIFRRAVHRLTVPVLVTFTPREGGLYQVLLREVAHDRHFGTLAIQVDGDPLS